MSKYCVYFIKAGCSMKANIKIGVTKDLERRIAELQIGNPLPLKCIAKVDCASRAAAYSMENALHRHLRNHRMQGEWFRGGKWTLKSALSIKELEEAPKKYNRVEVIGSHSERELARLKQEVHELRQENRDRRLLNQQLWDDMNNYFDGSPNRMYKF